MTLKCLDGVFSVCLLDGADSVNFESEYCFFGKTDDEYSLVCRCEDVPRDCVKREDGWCGFKIVGTLDFSLVGILARISSILAESGISIFAVSTYKTDYVFVKSEFFDAAVGQLEKNGYKIEK